MKYFFISICSFLSLNALSQCHLDYSNYQLIFSEDFDGYNGVVENVFGPNTIWHCLPDDELGGWGYEYYDRSQVSLVPESGLGYVLRLKATEVYSSNDCKINNNRRDDNGNIKDLCYKSGMLTLKHPTFQNIDKGIYKLPNNNILDVNTCNFNGTNNINDDRGFNYGMFEIRCKMPTESKGLWDVWPAIWLLGGLLEIDIADQIDANIGNTHMGVVINWAKQPWVVGNNEWEEITYETSMPKFKIEQHYNLGDKVNLDYPGGGGRTFKAKMNITPGSIKKKTESKYRDFSNVYTTFSVVWTPYEVSFFVEGREIFTVPVNLVNSNTSCVLRPIISLQMFNNWINSDRSEFYLDIDKISVYKPINNDYSLLYKSENAWCHKNVLKNSNYVNLQKTVKYLPNSLTCENDDIYYVDLITERLNHATKNGNIWSVIEIPFNYNPIFPNMLCRGDIKFNKIHQIIVYKGYDNRLQYFGKTNTPLGWYHNFIDDNWLNTNDNISPDDGSLDIAESTGDMFYKGLDGKIHRFYYQNTDFISEVIHHQYPSNNSNLVLGDVKVNESGNTIYYKGIDNRLQCYYFSSGVWHHHWIDNNWNSTAFLVNPKPSSLQICNENSVFYNGLDDKLHRYYWSNTNQVWEHELVNLNYYTSANLINTGFAWDNNVNALYYIGKDGRIQYVSFNSNYNVIGNGWVDDNWNNLEFASYGSNQSNLTPSITLNESRNIVYSMNLPKENIGIFSWESCENLATDFIGIEETNPNIFKSVNLEEKINFNQIAYPNPVTNFLNVNSNKKITKIKIYDVSGRLILQKDHDFNRLDLTNINCGLYILKIESDGFVENIKIQVVH